MFALIAFDADDTLWHTESLYVDVKGKLKELLAPYHEPEWVEDRLYETEMRNLKVFGYGIKAFTLSMIETAIELTEGRISGREIHQVIQLAKEMVSADIQLLPHVADTVATLAQNYPLMIITKGDLLDQEAKIAKSGLGPYFRHVEIVSHKNRATYETILNRHSITPERFLMVGNSLPSDILPVLELGGYGVHIPHAVTWAHEAAAAPTNQPKFHQLDHLGHLPPLVHRLSNDKVQQ
ncbi:MAG: HAD family hydrolase [Chloroflexi bacterium]|nr:HAD family hydrolase [Chloroflexota bacterium]MBP8057440.1 HAD family hydrolase [Chloroflexota bacterium]